MKKKKKKLVILIILVVVVLFASLYIYNNFFKNKEIEKEKQIISKIDGYNYELKEKDTLLYKNNFNELKQELNKDNIDYDNYAKLLGTLFIIDFYNLDNKVTNNDIGGIQFLCASCQETFVKKAHDTMYKYIQSNIYNDRKQELPIVDNVEMIDTDTISYKYENHTDNKAYKLKYKITYKKDLDYPKEVELVIIKNDNKLEIVEII